MHAASEHCQKYAYSSVGYKKSLSTTLEGYSIQRGNMRVVLCALSIGYREPEAESESNSKSEFDAIAKNEYITSFYEGWRDLMDNKSDPRTRNWPLMSSPFPTIAISLTYAYFVKVLGPKLMENRKPFQLRKVLIVYNFAQVIFSAWLFYESCIGGWLNGYNIRCEPVDYSPSPAALRLNK
ncbi:elongation of very long chain fatty acids protein-like [Teleopsis dalmanni]|uniref:elongation of very long chain fatty acids protein-like n=1 Tax=Teleopsis dalmanni TaxID=139649 RepID=UPI0018CD478F|nr:elongation of very long chain fatty acids protein-like [Teleopsis dalmanni]